MTDITVVDSIMGSGKTSYIFDYMNKEWEGRTDWDQGIVDNTKFIYITPFLDEVTRVKETCSGLEFADPSPVGGKKLDHFNTLVQEGRNIATTHKLFSLMNHESQDSLIESGYTLVIDEETECVREYEINKDDIRTLFEANMIHTDSDAKLRWNYEEWPTYRGEFSDIKSLCDNGSLVRVNDSFWVWEFPIKFLQMFHEVFILTYLFEGSLLSTYLKAHEMPYQMKAVDGGRLIDYTGNDTEVKRKLISLINLIEDPKLNAVGTPRYTENPLSKNWFINDQMHGGIKTKRLQHDIENFFRNRVKGKTAKNMWSSFKDYKAKLKGKGYTRGFVPCNARATNDYKHRSNLAYAVNLFVRPRLMHYFRQCGVEPNQELYALSQMVQWVWRSRIRDGHPINLYIPSQRMRELFKDWLHNRGSVGLKLVA